MPDLTIQNLYNYKSNTLRLSDFRGKLLILDFWATWCSPCIAMFPKMDSLQKVFSNEIQFLSVTSEEEKTVLPFIKKLENGHSGSVPIVYGDKELKKYFPHIYLPHYVWIAPDGKVLQFTSMEEINAGNIRKVLEGSTTLKAKEDKYIPFDRSRPIYVNGNGGKAEKLISFSLFSGYVEGIYDGTDIFRNRSGLVNRILCTNTGIMNLFLHAYSEDRFLTRNEVQLLVKDSSAFRAPPVGKERDDWSRKYRFCYDIAFEPTAKNSLYLAMQKDLSKVFPKFSARVLPVNRKCYVLKLISGKDTLNTRGGTPEVKFTRFGCSIKNATFNHFISRLRIYYLQKSPIPIIDETGITRKVDFSIEANLASVKDMNRALRAYGMEIISAERSIRTLQIFDTANLPRP